jgi:hypothetical protein
MRPARRGAPSVSYKDGLIKKEAADSRALDGLPAGQPARVGTLIEPPGAGSELFSQKPVLQVARTGRARPVHGRSSARVRPPAAHLDVFIYHFTRRSGQRLVKEFVVAHRRRKS